MKDGTCNTLKLAGSKPTGGTTLHVPSPSKYHGSNWTGISTGSVEEWLNSLVSEHKGDLEYLASKGCFRRVSMAKKRTIDCFLKDESVAGGRRRVSFKR